MQNAFTDVIVCDIPFGRALMNPDEALLPDSRDLDYDHFGETPFCFRMARLYAGLNTRRQHAWSQEHPFENPDFQVVVAVNQMQAYWVCIL